MTKGIAGYVATTGCLLNIPNAYDDERFNRYLHRFRSGTKQSHCEIVEKERLYANSNPRRICVQFCIHVEPSCNLIFMTFCSGFMVGDMCEIQHL